MIKIKNLFWPLTSRKLVIGAFMLALIAGVTVYLAFLRPVPDQEHAANRQQVDRLIDSSKFSEVEQLLKGYLGSRRLNDQQRYEASLMMATNYMNLGDKAAALGWYRQCYGLKADESPDVAYAIGAISLEFGDKTTAIDFYKKGVALARVDEDLLNDAYIGGYEKLIQSLESGQPLPPGPEVPPPGHLPPPADLPQTTEPREGR